MPWSIRRRKRHDPAGSLPGPLFIRDLIRHVDQELRGSQRERVAAGEAPIFEVDNLVLEVNFVATSSADARGGVDFKIITVGAGGSYERQQVHKVTLSMSAVKHPGDPLLDLEAEDYTAFRPREE